MTDFDNYKPKNVSGFYANFIRKRVKEVRHVDGNYVVEFDKAIVGQGVIIPDSLGFKPAVGMLAIWDADDSMGSVGDLKFYDSKTKDLLCSMHRRSPNRPGENWKDAWSIVEPENGMSAPSLEKTGNEASMHLSRIDKILEKMKKERKETMPKDFLPISSVMYRAFSENCNQERVADYLAKVQSLWQSGAEQQSTNSWEFHLVRAYQKMEKEGVINHEGVVKKPQELATGKYFNSCCRPAGSRDIDLRETKEFKKLAAQTVSNVATKQKG